MRRSRVSARRSWPCSRPPASRALWWPGRSSSAPATPRSEFFVVLRGRVAVVDDFETPAERVVGVHGDHRFVGELNLVTGQPALLSAVVQEPGEAIVLSRDELQAVVSANQQVGDVIVNALIARRALLIGRGSGLRLIGSHVAPDTRRLREFLTRNRIPHSFLDLETDSQAELLLRWLSIPPRETPLVLRGSLALRNPSNTEVAEALNLRTATASEELCDIVVVGAGPAGLGTAVYAASEGLSTVLVDSVALGGQASTSSRIENYLGFPAGISGSDLAERAAVQASRFGTRSAVPETASALSFEDGHHVVELDGGERLRARTVVVATGASYRRLGDREPRGVRGRRRVLRGHAGGGPDVRRQPRRGRRWRATPPDRPRCSSHSTSPGWISWCAAATWARECRATSLTRWRSRRASRCTSTRRSARCSGTTVSRRSRWRTRAPGPRARWLSPPRSCSSAPTPAPPGSVTRW